MGMTPEVRIFEGILSHLPNAKIVNWIEPVPRESMEQYASRLADTIHTNEPPVVCGVSFGGIVAQELAARLNAKACVVISSVRSPRELPPWVRLLTRLPTSSFDVVLGLAVRIATLVPRKVRTVSTARLTKLFGRSGAWHRWACGAVLGWRPSREVSCVPVVRIHGSRDSTFPIKYLPPDVTVLDGGHTIVWTHANQIADVIRRVAS